MAEEGIIPQEIRQTAAAIRATLREAAPEAREAAALLQTSGVRRIYIIGNGTSYHTSLAAAGLYRRHAHANDPTVIALPAGEFRHYLPELGDSDAVVGVSASGEFRDVLAVCDALHGRSRTIGIVHVPGSSLTRLADRVVVARGGPSSVPVMTKTFASTLTAVFLLMGSLLGDHQSDEIAASLEDAALENETNVKTAAGIVPGLADALADVHHVFVVGAGGAFPAAIEGALKLKETALIHAEGAETWEMASGAATIVGPETVVIPLTTRGPGRASTIDLAGRCAGWGAPVIEVGPDPTIEGARFVPLAGQATEEFACLTAVSPIALLAYHLARGRGIDPDRPGWVARYHSQGMTHVPTVED